jgi:hypothetical protein
MAPVPPQSTPTETVRESLDNITKLAHVNTFHPNAFHWPEASKQEEIEFLSEIAFLGPGHCREATAYVTKEMAQLAEIERHVAAVMTIVMSEMQGDGNDLSEGFELHHALSCFAAEEVNHADTFYRYVRELSGLEPTLGENLFAERLALYQGPESPYVKLAAICCSAYIGESVITVFERRTLAFDPRRERFFTRLLYVHGLDEARHVQTDHFVINEIIPRFGDEDRAALRRIITRQEELNFMLAERFQRRTSELFGVDYAAGNPSYDMQMRLTRVFSEKVLGGDEIRPIDELLSEADLELLNEFASVSSVHP